MKKLNILLTTLLLSLTTQAAQKPNIIFILADDMGIGDVSHNSGLAPTPHIDRLAKEGMRFTDAHSSSSVCTPTRYSLLTGRYNWRTHLKRSVYFTPHDKPLIEKNELTVASLLHQNGYHTACIGKWHLGIGWQFKPNFKRQPHQQGPGWDIDYTKPAITPTSHGFDYFYGIQASLDMPPYLYIENQKTLTPPTVTKFFKTPKRPGAAAQDFEANQCLKIWAEKSSKYIDQRATTPDKPFFLYLPLTSPHTPIVPSKEWLEKSPIGTFGDFLMETDWVVGEILKTLDKHNLTENTLIIFSTDNGTSRAADIPELTKKGHKPNGNLRGSKADIFEGGHNVPFIVSWPAKIKASTTTTRLTCQTDFTATIAEILNKPLPPEAAVDSISFLPTLTDPSITQRDPIVHHSINGSFAIRSGDYKLILCPGSGGWSDPKPEKAWKDKSLPIVQLYNLKNAPSETNNLQAQQPEKVTELTTLLAKYIKNGRSTPGPKQNNNGSIPFNQKILAKYPELKN